jgi:hypothetical protein
MTQSDREHPNVALPETAIAHQHAARLRNEAARLKAAHRYFQRTAYRRPFRREEIEGTA